MVLLYRVALKRVEALNRIMIQSGKVFEDSHVEEVSR